MSNTRVASVLLLTGNDVRDLLSMEEAIDISESVFRQKAQRKTQMPHKSYINFVSHDGDMRVMPGYLQESEMAGVKVVGVNASNPARRGLPTVIATVVLVDPSSGLPLCILDGTWLTSVRTGAAGGLAAKYLSSKDSSIVGMVGAGNQARYQMLALSKVRTISLVKVTDSSRDARELFAREMGPTLNAEIKVVETVRDATLNSDIVVTATTAKAPVVEREDISEGTHINAIGADAPGKQELDPCLLKNSKVVVDDYEQAIMAGELNVPMSQGVVSQADIFCELGEVIAGTKQIRRSDRDITIFDSTGLAIQDVGTAWSVFERAVKSGRGLEFPMFDLTRSFKT